MRKYKGSLTVETALVLPIFIILSISLISVIEMMNCYIEMEYAVHETAREIAILYYPTQEFTGYDEQLPDVIAEGILLDKIGLNNLSRLPIKNGVAGINIFRSEIGKNDEVDLIVTYKVTPLINVFKVGEMTLINRAKIHIWNGYSPGEEKELGDEYVYVTDYKSVYHTRANCSHLYIEINTVVLGDIEDIKNIEGNSYEPCKKCVSGEETKGDWIYVTNQGTAYHSRADCSGLKRTVYKVKLSEVSNLPMCERCQKYMSLQLNEEED